jgi:hypothetical protein
VVKENFTQRHKGSKGTATFFFALFASFAPLRENFIQNVIPMRVCRSNMVPRRV